MHTTRRTQRWVHLFVAVALAASVILTMPGGALACDFEEPPPPDEALDEATAVFSGEVVDIGVLGDNEEYEVRLAVERVWKGVSDSEVPVRTFIDEGICGFPFEGGQFYLVYAYGEPGELTTALFHRTTRWDRADADLSALGPGRPIEDVTVGDPVDASNSGTSPWLYAVVVAGVGVLAGIVMYLRRATAAQTDDDAE